MDLKELNKKVEELRLEPGDIVLLKLSEGPKFGVVEKVKFYPLDENWRIYLEGEPGFNTKMVAVNVFEDIKKVTNIREEVLVPLNDFLGPVSRNLSELNKAVKIVIDAVCW